MQKISHVSLSVCTTCGRACDGCLGKIAYNKPEKAHLDPVLFPKIMPAVKGASVTVTGTHGDPIKYKKEYLAMLHEELMKAMPKDITYQTSGDSNAATMKKFMRTISSSPNNGSAAVPVSICVSIGDIKAGAKIGEELPKGDPRVKEQVQVVKHLQKFADAFGVDYTIRLFVPREKQTDSEYVAATKKKFGIPEQLDNKGHYKGCSAEPWHPPKILKNIHDVRLERGRKSDTYQVDSGGWVYSGYDDSCRNRLDNLYENPLLEMHQRLAKQSAGRK
jgi:hypothetical protein